MSAKQEHKRRCKLRLEFIVKFTDWLEREPPKILFWRWFKWKKERPIFDHSKECDKTTDRYVNLYYADMYYTEPDVDILWKELKLHEG